jgi:2-polyprenyl-6-methoxyphenol hydroxylase-like FAD-dependent oxidoreductase
MRALVVGGGVAGPATALALHHVGFDVEVLERRADDPGDAGSVLTLAPNGVDALDALGVLDRVRSEAVPSRRNAMYGATGRLLGTVTLGSPLSDGTPALTLRRSRLAAVVSAAAREAGVRTRHEAPVRAVDVAAGTVALEDGTVLDADLVVGADGVHSLVRTAIDPEAPAPRYVGLWNFGGLTRASAQAAALAPEQWHFVFGRRAFFGAHPTPSGDVLWFLNVPGPLLSREERSARTTEEWREHLVGLLAVDAGPAAELVRGGELELAADMTYDLGHVPTWWRDRAVLVGDAAHAPSPSSGQGASMALEDAVVLADAIAAAPDVAAALAAYEQRRRARVERIVKAGARSSSSKIPGPIGRVFQEAVLRLVFRAFVTDTSVAWMTDYRVSREAMALTRPPARRRRSGR